MKKIKNMSRVELAAYIQGNLKAEGITVVLSECSKRNWVEEELMVCFTPAEYSNRL